MKRGHNDMVLLLCIQPDVAKYEAVMRKSCEIMEQILDVTTKDFLIANELYRVYSKDNFKLNPVSDSQEIIIHLQQIDVFSQRLQHSIYLLRALEQQKGVRADSIPADGGHDHAGFILKLVFFQLAMAGKTFIPVASVLKNQLQDIGVQQDNRNLLSHLPLVAMQLQYVQALLEEMAVQRQEESPIAPDIRNELAALSQLYTMESERNVLTWLEHRPQGTLIELLTHYEQQVQEQTHEIDFF